MYSLPGDWFLVQKGSVSSSPTFMCLGYLRALHSLPSSHVPSCLFLPAALVYHHRSLQCPTGALDIIQVILTVLKKRRGCEERWDDLPPLQGELVMSPGLDQSDASSLDARQAERHWMSLEGLLEKSILVPCAAATAFLHIYPSEWKLTSTQSLHTDVCSSFTYCPPVDEQINKLWYIQTMEYYSVL